MVNTIRGHKLQNELKENTNKSLNVIRNLMQDMKDMKEEFNKEIETGKSKTEILKRVAQ